MNLTISIVKMSGPSLSVYASATASALTRMHFLEVSASDAVNIVNAWFLKRSCGMNIIIIHRR